MPLLHYGNRKENSFILVQIPIVTVPALASVITSNNNNQLTSLKVKAPRALGGFGVYNEEFKKPYAPLLTVD